jgi:hypothetical protein
MLNEGNQIHNFISSSDSGTVINYGSGSGSGSYFLTSDGSGSGSTRQKVTVPTVTVPTVPVPVPQHCKYTGFVWRCSARLSAVREGPGFDSRSDALGGNYSLISRSERDKKILQSVVK